MPTSLASVFDQLHLFFLIVMFVFGTAACVFYYRVTAYLQSVGETTPGLFETKKIFDVFQKYHNVAETKGFPVWLPYGYWIALACSLVCGIAFVYWR
jgi:hypothetical protein